MGQIFLFTHVFGIVLIVAALVHFIKRRPEYYWIWIILMFGGLGAFVYLVVEALPDLGLLRGQFQVFSHRKRIAELETLVLDNPAPGNYEELGDLYMEKEDYKHARECFDKAITTRTVTPEPFYHRAICELELGDFAAAAGDLERVVTIDSKHDFHRAAGLLAHALAKTRRTDKAGALFQEVLKISTLSETQLQYAEFLMEQRRPDDARHWAQRILQKKATLPSYLKRRERPWFRRAEALLKQLPPGPAASA
jgi:hypothetical protein